MLPTGVAMYMLVFWDLIPTYAARTYYCTVHAGLKMHKTPEEWITENPDAAGKLTPIKNANIRRMPDGYQVQLNERFVMRHQKQEKAFGTITELKDSIIDKETNEILVNETDYKTGRNTFGTGANSFQDYKSWLHTRTCVWRPYQNGWTYNNKVFSELRDIYSEL
jgi:hypothetical protein